MSRLDDLLTRFDEEILASRTAAAQQRDDQLTPAEQAAATEARREHGQ